MPAFIDVTIIHAWSAEPSYVAVDDMLHSNQGVPIRTFGLPWYDPAIPPGSEAGTAILRNLLEGQVSAAQVVIAIPNLYGDAKSRKWIDIQFAAAQAKPIVVVTDEAGAIPQWLAERAREIVAFDAPALLAAIQRLAAQARP